VVERLIVAATTGRHLADVRRLFEEYAASLEADLSFQNFASELAGLPGDYAPPSGRLLLALVGGEPAGCVALRRWEPGTGEIKRLYVRPAHRGAGWGRRLAERVIAEAAAAGYRRIRLDTLPSMGDAHRLYAGLGFREIAPYRHNPVPGAAFLELDFYPAQG
jgi:putative acetyltransferase